MRISTIKVVTSKVMTFKVILWAIAILSGIYQPISEAVEVTNLYQVKVAVPDQSAKTRWGAFVTGFKEVLVRKSGSRNVLGAYEVQQAYGKVSAFIQRFQYATLTEKDAEFSFELQLDFDPRLVDELIQEAGMPIWGSNRPVTILWLAIEENLKRQIIKEDSAAQNSADSSLTEQQNNLKSFAEVFNKHAERRGVPVILPLMDLEDQLSITISDVWGRFITPVIEASNRYAADSIIAGRLLKVGEQWQAQLVFVNDDRETRLEFNEATPEQLFGTLANRLAELLCEKYCVVELAESNQIEIQVSNVKNFASYKKLQTYLEGLSSIRKVELSKIAGTFVKLNLRLLGDLESLKDGIRLGKKLIEEEAHKVDPFAISTEAAVDEFGNPVQVVDWQLDKESDTLLTDPQQSTDELTGEQVATSEVNQQNADNTGENAELVTLENSDTAQSIILYYRWQE
ncbi:DUF2066 domain-containing protein [Aliikangiella coralliicola]|uniref:DUF2066 domain-containing protein n=1 Tax=Aliikangiella coralliicola TaxID=2592383 RepID=A0A545U505_9GAMM|nr:DUF2066 domain-containing protein [Aliikangiella coralliicola]TQV84534.1 DUF2066 domain-containing protein [Aliikangiella coralliicola]